MNYSMMELVWLLLIYSFLGWVVETIVGTVKKEKVCKPWIFDRSVLSGVWNRSSIYGSHDGRLMAEPVFQLIGCGVLATIIE